jgi:drug/metabolite transporter (DMT)-like permease
LTVADIEIRQYSCPVATVRTKRLARRDLVPLALAAACWGLGTVVAKRAIDEMAPLVVLPIQLAGSLVVLALLMRRAGLALRGSPRLLGRLGLLNPGLAYALGLIGLTSISASLYVLLWALEPMLILILAAIFLGEAVSRRFVVLSVVAAAGTALAVYDPAAGGQWAGVVLVVAGVACCAAYTVIARRWVGTADSTAQVVLAQQAHALAFALVVALLLAWAGGGTGWSTISVPAVVAALGSGLLYYTAAYWFYLGALRRVPAGLAASSFYMIPVFGLLGSFVLLGERLEPAAWAGIGIVTLAIVAIVRLPTPSGARRSAAAGDPATG